MFFESNNHTIYPCTVCRQNCEDDPKTNKYRSIQCDVCKLWTHQHCSRLSNLAFNNLSQTNYLYYCINCNSELFPFHQLSNVEFYLESFNSIDNNSLNFINYSKNSQYMDPASISKTLSNSTTFLFLNIRSINCNFDKLHEFLTKILIKPTIIFLSETWLNSSKYCTNNLPGYSFVSMRSNSK